MDNPSFILGKEVKEYMVDDMQVFDFNKIEGMNQKAIIYIHGGSYIHHGVSFHFKMLKNISSKTNSRIIFPVYTLAPKYTYMDSYPKLLEFYKQLLKEYDSKDIIIMGDSVGGGLALGFSMYLRDNKIDVPNKLILLSP
ncbi:alpha/beta hydrolase [Pseudostreptobacillus hongkongensis]|uniref:alpha/beta hydrolase n=1 Tax=Pseudostreptobacillus hongkongensis TaxID=1162717 RepID=UPI0028D7DBCF|nr:alpha/beta hydrolase [Pseudostreptobacillus hongkongensis]